MKLPLFFKYESYFKEKKLFYVTVGKNIDFYYTNAQNTNSENIIFSILCTHALFDQILVNFVQNFSKLVKCRRDLDKYYILTYKTIRNKKLIFFLKFTTFSDFQDNNSFAIVTKHAFPSPCLVREGWFSCPLPKLFVSKDGAGP